MDCTTRELATIVITLRRDLGISVRPAAHGVTYVLEDGGRFYRLGEPEYVFASLLDGRRPFADAFAHAAAVSGADALTEPQAAGLCQWLVETGLASTEASRQADRLTRSQRQATRRRQAGRWNPIFWKTPLLRPDGFFAALARPLGWLLSAPVAALLVLLGLAGLVAAAIGSQRLGGHTLSAADGWWIAGAWLLLRVVHEGAHGLVARSLRCPVREAGLTWILLVPLPYVDITSAWRLDRRRDRMLVAAAGMIAELAIASVAAIVWAAAPPGPLREHAFHLMLSGSVVTVLFNANPLMRFDGYHLLADALELPNLAGHGQQAMRAIGRRWLYGIASPTPRWPEGRTPLIVGYGLAALTWRVLLCGSMIVAAEAMLYGAGVVLAVAAIGLWVMLPLAKIITFGLLGSKTQVAPRRRFLLSTATLAMMLAAVASVPWSPAVDAPAVFDFDPVVEVRSEAGGFVTTLDVRPGERVAAGQRLATLRNPELRSRRAEVAAELAATELRHRIALDAGEVATAEVLAETAAALLARRDDLDARLAELVVVAPVDGVVLDGDLGSRAGRYAAPGQALLQLGSGERRLIALVPEPHRAAIAVGQTAAVHLDGTGTDGVRPSTQPARVESISPQATTETTHPTLTALAGGPLAVRTLSAEERSTQRDDAGVRLLRPHFEARLQLGTAPAAGRTGTVRLSGERTRLGPHAVTVARDWWDRHRAERATR